MRPPCTIPECDKPSAGRGLCRKHYMRRRRTGDPYTAHQGNLKHGESNSKNNTEYNTWRSMISRCTNPNNPQYYNYGGKGVKVCARWLTSYTTFLSDLGRKPSPVHSIDRYPNNKGDYEPGNVRWATPGEQQRNTSRNRWITVKGKTMCLKDWAVYAGVNQHSVSLRIKKYGEANLAEWLDRKKREKSAKEVVDVI